MKAIAAATASLFILTATASAQGGGSPFDGSSDRSDRWNAPRPAASPEDRPTLGDPQPRVYGQQPTLGDPRPYRRTSPASCEGLLCD